MAQTLKFGDGTWATKKGSTLAYNDENGNYKPLPFATTRSTSATRVNKQGLIEVVEGDRPRIDFSNDANGALLLEPSRSNLVTYSEDFSNAYWSKSGSSITSDSVISPDGTLNADKLVENSDTVEHFLRRSLSNPTGFYFWSVFVKADERKYVVLRTNADGGAYKNACFDVELGVVVYDGLHQSRARIESFEDDWFRVSGYVKETSGTSRNYQIHVSNSAIIDNGAISYDGDGTSGVYIYGAQLEEGSYATSYIPTQGSTVTRVADTASGSGNSEVFNDSEGVLFANIAALTQDNDDTVELCINNGTTNNRLSISFQTATNALRVVARVSGVNQVNRTKTLSDITLFNKIAFKYKQNDYSVFVNGFEILTDTIGTTFPTSTLNTFDFDRADGGTPFYGKTKQIGYYNTILTDLELETLTSYRTWLSMVNELNLNVIYNG